jgi:hypothetical protein|tara:strand:+ start:545 stop:883 length:339 start_codon:yes stop_codon:yes gene_type:complete
LEVTLSYGQEQDGRQGKLVLDADTGDMTLEGFALSAQTWESLNRRVMKVLQRAGLASKPTPAPTPAINKFFADNDNLQVLNRINRGKVKKAPFPLSLFYEAVITKKELDDFD